MAEKDRIRNTVNPPVKKKHIQVLEEVERFLEANKKYCEMNNCSPTPYMCGANDVLSSLVVFINRL